MTRDTIQPGAIAYHVQTRADLTARRLGVVEAVEDRWKTYAESGGTVARHLDRVRVDGRWWPRANVVSETYAVWMGYSL